MSTPERAGRVQNHEDSPTPALRRRDLLVAVGALSGVIARPAAAQTPGPVASSLSGAPRGDNVRVNKVAPGICQVTYNLPPANLITASAVTQLHAAVSALARDNSVRVVVFRSDNADFFLNHFDLREARDFPRLGGPSSRAVWIDLVLSLSQASFVSIACIRGRTRGGGNEFALACDLRYASLERAHFGQPEVGTGILPGGGGSERLPRLVGRDRALEVILGSQDYDAATAERYGWVTRALPDAALDGFVDSFAARLASFDGPVLAAAKAQVNRATLPPPEDFDAAYAEYTQSLAGAGFPQRMRRLGQLIGSYGMDVEMRLGHYLGLIGP